MRRARPYTASGLQVNRDGYQHREYDVETRTHTAADTNTILALPIVQLCQEGRDRAFWHLCKDEMSERLGGIRWKGKEGRQADQELLKQGGNAYSRKMIERGWSRVN